MSKSNYKFAKTEIPHISVKTSKFNLSYGVDLTVQPNTLTPIFRKSCMQAETDSLSMSVFSRMLNLLRPVFDNLRADFYTIWAPNRLLSKFNERVIGMRTSEFDTNEYQNPYIVSSNYITGNNSFVDDDNDKDTSNEDTEHIVFTQKKLSFKEYPLSVIYNVPDPVPMKKAMHIFDQAGVTSTTQATKEAAIELEKKKDRFLPNFKIGSLAEYLYVTPGVSHMALNANPFIAYYLIYDEWFRQERFTPPLVSKDPEFDKMYTYRWRKNGGTAIREFSFQQPGIDPSNIGCICNTWEVNQRHLSILLSDYAPKAYYLSLDVTQDPSIQQLKDNINAQLVGGDFLRQFILKNGGLCPVSKKPDYWTMNLPSPQQGDPVSLPVTLSVNQINNVVEAQGQNSSNVYGNGNAAVLHVSDGNGGAAYRYGAADYDNGLAFGASSSPAKINDTYAGRVNVSGSVLNSYFNLADKNYSGGTSNVYADTSNLKSTINNNQMRDYLTNALNFDAGTILQLRQCFQAQKYAERENLAGHKIDAIYKMFFGVVFPTYLADAPILLDIKHASFSNIPVVQTSGTQEDGTPQGNLTANSVLRFGSHLTTVSCQEPGELMVFVVFRGKTKYQSYMERDFFRFLKFDYFWREFQLIGDQSTYSYEIHIPATKRAHTGTGSVDVSETSNNQLKQGIQESVDRRFDVFGYQARYEDYKYKADKVIGTFNSRSYLVASQIAGVNEREIRRFTTDNLKPSNIQGGIDYIPSLDRWHLAYNFDTNIDGNFSSDYLKDGVQADNYESSNIHQVKLNQWFLASSTPWQRSMYDTQQYPIQMNIKFKLITSLPMVTLSVPGLADHF